MNPFKYARMVKRIKQKVIADLVGISRGQLANIENDISMPSALLMLKLMIILNIKAETLIVYYKLTNVKEIDNL